MSFGIQSRGPPCAAPHPPPSKPVQQGGAATVAKPKQAQKMQKHVYVQDIYSCLPHNIHFRPYFSWTGCGSWSDQDQAKIVWQWLSHNNWGRHNG